MLGQLFSSESLVGKDIVWLADQVIAYVQHHNTVSLELEHGETGRVLVCRENDETGMIAERECLRVFRPLMARIAVVACDETGSQFQPYGGTYIIHRSARTGPIQLVIEFCNTLAVQKLTITRVPVDANTHAHNNGTPASLATNH